MAIKENNNGTYTIYYRDANKRARQETVRTKTLAKELLSKRMAERTDAVKFGKEHIEVVTVSELSKKYNDYSRTHKRKSTFETQIHYLKKLLPFFGKMTTVEIKAIHLDKYKSERAIEVSNGTINRELSILRAMLQKAKEWGHLENIPKFSKLKEPPGRIRYLTQNEAKKLIEVCSNEQTRNIILVALMTGMRRGEILNLKWPNIDLQHNMIHIEDSKTHERRDIPISPELKKVFEGMGQINDRLFDIKSVKTSFHTALKRAGIKNFRFHDLRHTFASWLVISGTSLLVVKELLGHKKLDMTLRYAHLSPDVRSYAVNLIGEKIANITLKNGD